MHQTPHALYKIIDEEQMQLLSLHLWAIFDSQILWGSPSLALQCLLADKGAQNKVEQTGQWNMSYWVFWVQGIQMTLGQNKTFGLQMIPSPCRPSVRCHALLTRTTTVSIPWLFVSTTYHNDVFSRLPHRPSNTQKVRQSPMKHAISCIKFTCFPSKNHFPLPLSRMSAACRISLSPKICLFQLIIPEARR